MDIRVIGEARAGDPVIARSIVVRAGERLPHRYSIVMSSLSVEPDDEGWRHVGKAFYIGKNKKPQSDYLIWWHRERDEVKVEVM